MKMIKEDRHDTDLMGVETVRIYEAMINTLLWLIVYFIIGLLVVGTIETFTSLEIPFEELALLIGWMAVLTFVGFWITYEEATQ